MVKPNVGKPPKNGLFCVTAGTTINWTTSSSAGFVLAFGSSTPFASAVLVGTPDQPAAATATARGCYKYSVAVCDGTDASGAPKCGRKDPKVIVSGDP